MSEKYHVLHPDGRIVLEEIPRDQMLDRMHEIIDCDMIERVVTCIPDLYLVIDEEGKIKNLPQEHNEYASLLYVGYWLGSDDIVGPAILCSEQLVGPYNEPDFAPLEPEVLAKLRLFFGDQVTWEGC